MQATRLILSELTPEQKLSIKMLIGNSFFSSQGFMELCAIMSGNSVYWVVEENSEILAVLPAVEFGISKLKRLQSLPDGCYSSIFTRDNINTEKCKIELLKAILLHGYQKIFIYDFYSTMSKAEDYDILQCQTTLIDVSSPDWQPPDKKLQSEIRKADRENVIIEKFASDKHLVQFFELMNRTEYRHSRKPKYSELFFMNLAELAEHDNRIIWDWCEHEGKAVSSHISFVEQNQILNWQVYFDKKYSFLKANQKMLFNLAAIARERNIKYLNLGASPIDTPTLSEYKDKWGGVTKEYNCYYKKSLLGKIF